MKIAIVGFGIEGQASYDYYKKQNYTEEIVVYDENADTKVPKKIKAVLGAGVLDKIPEDFVVIRTSGLDKNRITSGGKMWTATNEFFAQCPAQIIGVTGSKGKGTTASFIAGILRAGGIKVHLLGNIGVPALEILPRIKPQDVVVFELSSFQLWDIAYSPHIAVITNVEPDHLDVHSGYDDYTKAKANIVAQQKLDDMVVYNQLDKAVQAMVKSCVGRKLPFPSLKFAHSKQGVFYYGKSRICPTSTVKLPGYHNLLNAMAAINATYELVGGDKAAIAKGLGSFNGLPHRLRLVRTVAGVSYYDDSIATTPGSAIAAINSFGGPKILILGGSDKGADYRELARQIADKKKRVKAVVAIGENRDKILAELGRVKYKNIHVVESKKMDDIVAMAASVASAGDVVIMTPATASFDMFKSYSDRGEKFVAAVKRLKK